MNKQKATKSFSLITIPLMIFTAVYFQTSMAEDAALLTNAESQVHTVSGKNRQFTPDIIYINPGDTVGWEDMLSHNTVSVEELTPEGATSWSSAYNDNFKIKLDVEGIYAYACHIHAGLGMVGIIVVGKPTDLEQVKQYAAENLQAPYTGVIDKLENVSIP